MLLESQKIRFVKGTAAFLDPKTIEVSSNGNKESFKANHVVIATGSQAASLPGIGMDGERIFSSKEALDLKEIPQSLLIIGGGVIGVEFATIFHCLGYQPETEIQDTQARSLATTHGQVLFPVLA